MRIKYSGRIPDDDSAHRVLAFHDLEQGPPPGCVYVPGVGCVPQYAPTVIGTNLGFDPANDCDGYFTSSKFQAHNNCYNYAIDIATSTMAQPGRRHSVQMSGDTDPDQVVQGAEADGLILIGGYDMTLDEVREKASTYSDGRFVALLVAPAVHEVGFTGDFHWVRADDDRLSHWSQKDGPDQVTNFDFAGRPIRNPRAANWRANGGPFQPKKPGEPDFIVTYAFRAWMFVPSKGVDVI